MRKKIAKVAGEGYNLNNFKKEGVSCEKTIVFAFVGTVYGADAVAGYVGGG